MKNTVYKILLKTNVYLQFEVNIENKSLQSLQLLI